MATFEAQVEALTSLSIDSSSSPTQTELTQFLTDGAAEVINSMPRKLKFLCATEDDFTSTAVGSETETLESGQILQVTRHDGQREQPCREIPAMLRGRASDSDDMIAATATDPVYYVYDGKINSLPASGNCKYLEVNNPAVAFGASTIDNFPDEYEYLVPLYASIKSLQNALADRASNSDINTAITAVKSAVEAAATTIASFTSATESVFGDENTFLTNNSQLTRVKDALDKAQETITGDKPDTNTDARGAQQNEDIELVTSALNIAQTEIQRAQVHLSEWNAIGDMRIKQVQVNLSKMDGYIKEVQTRLSIIGFLERQQAKLQADYEKGIQIMRGA